MTAKALQIAQILSVSNGIIRVAHPSVNGNTTTYLRAPIAAGATAMSVADNTNLANTDALLVGAVGDQTTEMVLVNGAVTFGSSITVANTLAFAHELDAQVTKLFERQVKILGSTTVGGSTSVVATVNIQWGKPYTEYALATADTAYAYYSASFYDGTTTGTAGACVASTGVSYAAVESFIQQALDLTDSEIDPSSLSRNQLVRWAQDCQDAVTQFMYEDPVNRQFKQKDWAFEVIEDISSITTTVNENKYALSALASASKYPNSDKSIIDVRIGTGAPLKKIDIYAYDQIMQSVARTTVATQPGIGATSLVLTDGSEFNTGGGTVLVGSDILTYSARTANTLTGIPATGAGSITSAYTVGTAVWQGMTAASPKLYVIFNGYMLFDKPIDSDHAGLKVKIRYYYAIPRITLVSDTTVIPFTNVFQYYLAARIENRRQNLDKAAVYMGTFDKLVTQNALADKIPVTDSYNFYNYGDALYQNPNWNSDYEPFVLN